MSEQKPQQRGVSLWCAVAPKDGRIPELDGFEVPSVEKLRELWEKRKAAQPSRRRRCGCAGPSDRRRHD